MTFAEAQRAIYIDFECLATPPPHPALLGVLVGSGDERFEQIITDERLAPARVAKKTLRVAMAREAAGQLLARANAENRLIVGWSLFDRDRLIDANPERHAEIKARYVNALQIARPWGRKLHPDVAIAKEDRFSPKHTLDKYAHLALYADSKLLRNAAPARWIRHMIRQLAAKKGKYRRTTRQAKRDWHRLVDYNRHDCLALRHVVLKASRELECWRAYERTRFCVDDGPRRICFMAGSNSRKLEALLRRKDAVHWAFITAWNPASARLTRRENEARQRELQQDAVAAGYSLMQGRSVNRDPNWPAEESFLILGVSRGKAVTLGRRFGQLAIVTGRRGGPAQLVPCAGGTA